MTLCRADNWRNIGPRLDTLPPGKGREFGSIVHSYPQSNKRCPAVGGLPNLSPFRLSSVNVTARQMLPCLADNWHIIGLRHDTVPPGKGREFAYTAQSCPQTN